LVSSNCVLTDRISRISLPHLGLVSGFVNLEFLIYSAGRKRQETFMRDRSLVGALLLAVAVLPISSCVNNGSLTSIVVSPAAVTTTQSFGLQAQFTAIGYYTRPNHAPTTKDITDQVTWTSSFPQMVSMGPTGLATVTGAAYGNTIVTASAQGFHGIIQGTANFTVTQIARTPAVTRLSIVSPLRSLPTAGSTVRFTAVGVTANGGTSKLAGQPEWTTTDSEVASIDKATGALTTLGPGRTTITAKYTNPDGTTAIGVVHLFVAPRAE
jgi:hypothetical protein